MYEIIYTGSVGKKFERLLDSLSKNRASRLLRRLSKHPHTNRAKDERYGRVEKKGKFWCYYLPQGYRVIYDIIKKEKVVLILFSGNHDNQIRFLRKHSK